MPSVSKKEGAVLRMAFRETSPVYVNEFEPITKGVLFAVAALAPLGMLAAIVIIGRAAKRVLRALT